VRYVKKFAVLLMAGSVMLLSGCSPPSPDVLSSRTPDITKAYTILIGSSMSYSGYVLISNKDGTTAEIDLSGLFAKSTESSRGLLSIGINNSDGDTFQDSIISTSSGKQTKLYLSLTEDLEQRLVPLSSNKTYDAAALPNDISIIKPFGTWLEKIISSNNYKASTENPLLLSGTFEKKISAASLMTVLNDTTDNTAANILLETTDSNLLSDAKTAITGANEFDLSVIISNSNITEISIKSTNWDSAGNGTDAITGEENARSNINGLSVNLTFTKETVKANDISLPKNPYSGTLSISE
jgi:hypothetical protein